MGFTEDFAGINFRKFNLTKDFAEINFRESALFKEFSRVNSKFALKNMFSTTLVYGFKNNLSENWYFFTEANDQIADGLEKN